ncbi:NUDIX domain-containing protein [Streptomyces sp. NPDC003002]
MTLLVAAVFVPDEATNRVVVLQRSEDAQFAHGLWDLPVGKTEPGEPINGTAVRELYEETGLTVKPESLKVAHILTLLFAAYRAERRAAPASGLRPDYVRAQPLANPHWRSVQRRCSLGT